MREARVLLCNRRSLSIPHAFEPRSRRKHNYSDSSDYKQCENHPQSIESSTGLQHALEIQLSRAEGISAALRDATHASSSRAHASDDSKHNGPSDQSYRAQPIAHILDRMESTGPGTYSSHPPSVPQPTRDDETRPLLETMAAVVVDFEAETQRLQTDLRNCQYDCKEATRRLEAERQKTKLVPQYRELITRVRAQAHRLRSQRNEAVRAAQGVASAAKAVDRKLRHVMEENTELRRDLQRAQRQLELVPAPAPAPAPAQAPVAAPAPAPAPASPDAIQAMLRPLLEPIIAAMEASSNTLRAIEARQQLPTSQGAVAAVTAPLQESMSGIQGAMHQLEQALARFGTGNGTRGGMAGGKTDVITAAAPAAGSRDPSYLTHRPSQGQRVGTSVAVDETAGRPHHEGVHARQGGYDDGRGDQESMVLSSGRRGDQDVPDAVEYISRGPQTPMGGPGGAGDTAPSTAYQQALWDTLDAVQQIEACVAVPSPPSKPAGRQVVDEVDRGGRGSDVQRQHENREGQNAPGRGGNGGVTTLSDVYSDYDGQEGDDSPSRSGGGVGDGGSEGGRGDVSLTSERWVEPMHGQRMGGSELEAVDAGMGSASSSDRPMSEAEDWVALRAEGVGSAVSDTIVAAEQMMSALEGATDDDWVRLIGSEQVRDFHSLEAELRKLEGLVGASPPGADADSGRGEGGNGGDGDRASRNRMNLSAKESFDRDGAGIRDTAGSLHRASPQATAGSDAGPVLAGSGSSMRMSPTGWITDDRGIIGVDRRERHAAKTPSHSPSMAQQHAVPLQETAKPPTPAASTAPPSTDRNMATTQPGTGNRSDRITPGSSPQSSAAEDQSLLTTHGPTHRWPVMATPRQDHVVAAPQRPAEASPPYTTDEYGYAFMTPDSSHLVEGVETGTGQDHSRLATPLPLSPGHFETPLVRGLQRVGGREGGGHRYAVEGGGSSGQLDVSIDPNATYGSGPSTNPPSRRPSGSESIGGSRLARMQPFTPQVEGGVRQVSLEGDMASAVRPKTATPGVDQVALDRSHPASDPRPSRPQHPRYQDQDQTSPTSKSAPYGGPESSGVQLSVTTAVRGTSDVHQHEMEMEHEAVLSSLSSTHTPSSADNTLRPLDDPPSSIVDASAGASPSRSRDESEGHAQTPGFHAERMVVSPTHVSSEAERGTGGVQRSTGDVQRGTGDVQLGFSRTRLMPRTGQPHQDTAADLQPAATTPATGGWARQSVHASPAQADSTTHGSPHTTPGQHAADHSVQSQHRAVQQPEGSTAGREGGRGVEVSLDELANMPGPSQAIVEAAELSFAMDAGIGSDEDGGLGGHRGGSGTGSEGRAGWGGESPVALNESWWAAGSDGGGGVVQDPVDMEGGSGDGRGRGAGRGSTVVAGVAMRDVWYDDEDDDDDDEMLTTSDVSGHGGVPERDEGGHVDAIVPQAPVEDHAIGFTGRRVDILQLGRVDESGESFDGDSDGPFIALSAPTDDSLLAEDEASQASEQMEDRV